MRWVMVAGPLAIAVACGGRSERLIGDDAGAGGASDGGDGNDTGGSAGKGQGGSAGRGGSAGKGAAGGSVSTGGSGGTIGKGGTGGTLGKGGSGGKGFPGGTGGTFPGKGGFGGFGASGGFAGKAPVGGAAGTGFGGLAGVSGFGASGGAGGIAGAGGLGGFGGAPNACTPNPCLNGGTCLPDPSGSITCQCAAGFTGSRCEIASNPCPLTPCMHGGECVMTPAGAECACPPDWHGESCECRVDDDPVAGGCRLRGVCGLPEPRTYGSGNCSSNTGEFADWWCQLAGYEGAATYEAITANSFDALFYEGKEPEVLSECSQVKRTNAYFYGPGCTGVRDLVCGAAPVSEVLRQRVLVCGGSDRGVDSFLPVGADLSVEDGCLADSTTQAVLVSRDGTALASSNLRAYLHDGGVVLTEYGNSDELFSSVFPATFAGLPDGSCTDNAPTTVRFNEFDRFWLDNPYQQTPYDQTGCGFDVSGFPRLVALGGWTASHVSIGYRNLGRGRFWATDFDWSDNYSEQTDYTRRLLGYMITHRR